MDGSKGQVAEDYLVRLADKPGVLKKGCGMEMKCYINHFAKLRD